MPTNFSRRDFLFGAGSIGLGVAGLTSCAISSAIPYIEPPNSDSLKTTAGKYHPVKSSWDRVISTVVGLRPYRPLGYRVETEVFGKKTVIHNYGHGGAGISLSWGTSIQATHYALQQQPNSVEVLGAGVMGITTALLLAQKGVDVTVYASDFVPNTTSDIAAALWLPTTYLDRKLVSPAFLAKDDQISRNSFSRFLDYVNRPEYGVYWHRYHYLNNKTLNSDRELPGGNALYPELEISTSNNLFGFPYQVSMQCLMIDPSYYLRRLMQDAQSLGVKFELRSFNALPDVLALKSSVIMNCTGLGARSLFGDESLIPIQGQLTHLLPQSEINYSYVAPGKEGFLYMFPRKDSIVLGGTSMRGEFGIEPDLNLARDMVSEHALLAQKI